MWCFIGISGSCKVVVFCLIRLVRYWLKVFGGCWVD